MGIRCCRIRELNVQQMVKWPEMVNSFYIQSIHIHSFLTLSLLVLPSTRIPFLLHSNYLYFFPDLPNSLKPNGQKLVLIQLKTITVSLNKHSVLHGVCKVWLKKSEDVGHNKQVELWSCCWSHCLNFSAWTLLHAFEEITLITLKAKFSYIKFSPFVFFNHQP